MEADYDKLSPVGETQSRKLGEYWVRHRLTFDRVFHGPARRHTRTAEIAGQVVQGAGMPWPKPVVLPAFDEFDAFTMMRIMLPVLAQRDPETRRLQAEYEEVSHTPEAGRRLQKLFEQVSRLWCTGEFDVPDIESWAQFNQRVTASVQEVRDTASPSSSTVIFTSAGPIAATLAYSLELTPVKAIEFVWLARNASYAQFVFSGERFSMHAFNAIPHLDALELFTYR
jgi:broad specificity phosphatase PhoE